ncbi:hypothetical protein PQO03_13095 [Lentisphaera profundi]|uniref:Pyridoxamine 5'-phosphate oxidase Alr4036 family FMN-binding domain-containing protein n=1 Tax=Lentisphaera profundi TaxID=1658616 RepID=A0ABY7W3C7_9BACT|nr:hypothetical protein [Lentisphaera profundi]WDE98773.1 hypothetical protein PQO03_13095 [Lentisphaera profundi]
MPENIETHLSSALDLSTFCFAQLTSAGKDYKHPWRLVNLALSNELNQATNMTLVLRDFENKEATIFTDSRSSKIKLFEQKPFASLCFYDPKIGLQLQAHCTVKIHHQDLICDAYWKQIRESSRLCYAAGPSPGTVLEKPFSFSTQGSCELPSENFTVLKFHILDFDILYLNTEGNIRAQGTCNKNNITTNWIAP